MNTDYASLLNSSQLEAVTTENQHVRIIAGAGSGKTRVLTYRVAYLIEMLHVDPSRIMAVTFTNKAANEMKTRVGKLVPEAAPYLQVSTFHSFCNRFLRREASFIGYPAGFTIFDEDDQEKLVKDIAADHNMKKSDPLVKLALGYIRKKKGMGIYPEDITITHEAFQNEKDCLRFYMDYEQRKEAMLCFDFDDLINKAIYILENNEDARARWQRRFTHILIDEFQDTNDVEDKLIKLLLTPETHLYVVGDPDQTIYTWRGANQSIILNFPHVFPDAIDIVLSRNYRSTKNILSAANKLISHNKKRVPKDLFTEEDAGDAVTVHRSNDAAEEAKWVVDQIVKEAGKEYPPDFRNIAVLYRASYMTRSLETEFASQGVPYRIYGGLRFYQRKEVKDVLAYFRLLLNPLDDVSFARIANVPKRNIGEVSLERLRVGAQKAGVSLYEYVSRIDEFDDVAVGPRVITALSALVAIMEDTKKKLSDNLEAYSATLKNFITDIGYYQYIAEEQGLDEDRVGNVNALFDDITHFLSNNPESTFEEYLQNITLLTAQDDMNDGNYVSLMTIHVAKGLEFDNVFVICMNQGSFPSDRAQMESGNEGMEEERRLAYVAFTRAKKKLFCSTNSGYTYVTDSHATPSQFFKEAGLEFPREQMARTYSSSSYWGSPSYGESSWNKPRKARNYDNFFSDGDAITPFEEKPKPKPEPKKPASNGITSWKAGDELHHERFGDGRVLEVIDGTIIIVRFEDGVKKTLMGSHPMISKKVKEGGQA